MNTTLAPTPINSMIADYILLAKGHYYDSALLSPTYPQMLEALNLLTAHHLLQPKEGIKTDAALFWLINTMMEHHFLPPLVLINLIMNGDGYVSELVDITHKQSVTLTLLDTLRHKTVQKDGVMLHPFNILAEKGQFHNEVDPVLQTLIADMIG